MKIFFNTDYIVKKAIYDYDDFKQWLSFENEVYESYGYDFGLLGVRSIQLNNEPTKLSIRSFIDFPTDLQNSKSILNIRNYKNNCLQLSITALLHPTIEHVTHESKNVHNLIEPRQ